MIYRAQLATLDDYVGNLDSALRAYAMSPARGVSARANEAAERTFQQPGDAYMMPYLRGDLIALIVDREIRRRSGGKRTLDSVMKELLAEARAGEKLTADRLLARFERDTSPAFVAKIRGVIERGDELVIDPTSFEPCLRGAMTDTPRFDLGFDFDASWKQKRIVGTRDGSAFARAGGRDGDELVGAGFMPGVAEQEVSFRVRRGGVEQQIKFEPRGESVPVLVFSIGDAQACTAMEL